MVSISSQLSNNDLLSRYYLNDSTDETEINSFLQGKKKIVLKPYNSFFGRGVEIVDVSKNVIDRIKNKLSTDGECLIEDYIEQSRTMSKLHPQSVNTVRIPAYSTFKTDGKATIHRPFLKIGIGDSVVDNGGAGGMLVAIDADSGITKTVGIDEKGREYIIHPDTKEIIVGFQLPEWNQLITIVNEIMLIDPETRYVGWDFAHTDNGWVLVEGNDDGQFVGQQMPLHNGCFKDVQQIMNRV